MLRWVTSYVWTEWNHECNRADYWSGLTAPHPETGNGRWVVVEPDYREWPNPDIEVLECGHENRIPTNKSGKVSYFSLRRRCKMCAHAKSKVSNGRDVDVLVPSLQ